MTATLRWHADITLLLFLFIHYKMRKPKLSFVDAHGSQFGEYPQLAQPNSFRQPTNTVLSTINPFQQRQQDTARIAVPTTTPFFPQPTYQPEIFINSNPTVVRRPVTLPQNTVRERARTKRNDWSYLRDDYSLSLDSPMLLEPSPPPTEFRHLTRELSMDSAISMKSAPPLPVSSPKSSVNVVKPTAPNTAYTLPARITLTLDVKAEGVAAAKSSLRPEVGSDITMKSSYDTAGRIREMLRRQERRKQRERTRNWITRQELWQMRYAMEKVHERLLRDKVWAGIRKNSGQRGRVHYGKSHSKAWELEAYLS